MRPLPRPRAKLLRLISKTKNGAIQDIREGTIAGDRLWTWINEMLRDPNASQVLIEPIHTHPEPTDEA